MVQVANECSIGLSNPTSDHYVNAIIWYDQSSGLITVEGVGYSCEAQYNICVLQNMFISFTILKAF
jgi:hypothetical protein